MTRSCVALLLVLGFAVPSFAGQPLDDQQSWRRLVAALEPAAMVSIRLKDGKQIVGTLVDHSDESVILKPRTRIPVAARAIPFSDIDSIERKKIGWSPGAKVVFGVGVSFGALMLATLVAFAAYGD